MEDKTDIKENTNAYIVKTSEFEGPLDTLLSLIEKRKLFINDISLAKVTDDFIAYIQNSNSFSIQESTEFIFTASTLLLIKSKSLLPSMPLTEEEEESIEELEARLKTYKKLKELSECLREGWGREVMFLGSGEPIGSYSFSPDQSMTIQNLEGSVREILENFPTEDVIPQTKVKETVKLENVINSLIKRITSEIKTSFREFSGIASGEKLKNKEDRIMVVVSFIAVLELIKQGALQAKQEKYGEDIFIESMDVQTPHYM